MSVAWEAGGFETSGLRKIGRRRWADGMEPSARGVGLMGCGSTRLLRQAQDRRCEDSGPVLRQGSGQATSASSGQATSASSGQATSGKLRTGHFGKLRTGHFGKLRTGHFGKLRTGHFGKLRTGHFGKLRTGHFGKLRTGHFGKLRTGHFGKLRTGHFGKLRTGHFGKLRTGSASSGQATSASSGQAARLRTGHFGKLRTGHHRQAQDRPLRQAQDGGRPLLASSADRPLRQASTRRPSGTSHRPLRQAQDRLAMNGWGLGVRGGPLTLALDAAHGCSASGEGYRRRRLALTFFHWEREKTDAGLPSLTPRTVALPHGRRRRSGASTGRPLTLPSPPRRGIRGRPLAPALDAPTRLLSLRRGI